MKCFLMYWMWTVLFIIPGLIDNSIGVVAVNSNEADLKGPVFTNEPLNRIDFSNSTGAVVECRASGNPPPEIIWIRSDSGTAVGDVPGLRQVLSNGNLVFPPFRAEDYRQEVHAQVYACMAKNSIGSIISRDVHVRAAIIQYYDTDVIKEFAIRGNSVVMKCQIPSFVQDFVNVVSWHTDQNETFYPGREIVVTQYYEADVNKEHVIRGNSAIIKCLIPSFVADFVEVVSWHTDQDETFSPNTNYVVSQHYDTDGSKEYVIRGNSAIIKCQIPSFVADFVSVVSWHTDQDETFYPDNKYVVIQAYEAEADNEYIIRGNSAIMKCEIPSFVADFVFVDSWEDSEGKTYLYNNMSYSVVHQFYEVRVIDEFVLRGNSVILKCLLPSFVTEFVEVEAWLTSEGEEFKANDNNLVVAQAYSVSIMDEHVLRGNTAILKCHIPSFVSDFVAVDAWIDDEGVEYYPNRHFDGKYLVLPSGELHIKEVGPEDGYKSYQCRTKHRLTGETRLSATKGRLVITEPIASTKPKIDELYRFSVQTDESGKALKLICPAQAYPRPVFNTKPKIDESDRFNHQTSNSNTSIRLNCLGQAYPRPIYKTNCKYKTQKPVGSVPPKLSSGDKTRTVESKINGSITMLCPMQSLPNPLDHVPQHFRLIPKVLHFNDRQILALHYFVKLKLGQLGFLKPIGSRPPTFSIEAKSSTFVKATNTRFALLCQAQAWPVEPIGSRPPTFSTESKTSSFIKEEHSSFSLLCQAQAWPVGVFKKFILQKKNTPVFPCCVKLKLGLLGFLKPIGFRAPAFSSHSKSITFEEHAGTTFSLFSTFKQAANTSFALLCQAQAWPVGLQIQALHCYAKRKHGQLGFLKPIGYVKPRLSSGDKIRFLDTNLNATFTLLCPMQSYPTSLYRDKFIFHSAKIKSSTALFCLGQSYPTPVFKWYKYIEGTTRKSAVVLDDRVKQVSGTLIIKDAVVEDSGKYLCVVNNSVGGESVETVLTVTAPLSAKIEPQTQVVDFGRPAVFTCHFSGNPIKTISWTKDGKSIKHSDPVLKIESVKKENKGMYQCFIRNDQESAQASAELKLGVDPPVIKEAFTEETLHPGPSVFLRCIAHGNPTPEISWELDGKKISNNERYQVGQYVTVNGAVVSYLNITSVHTNDGGLYKCTASSKVGTVSHEAKLNIYGLPFIRPMEKKPIVAGETLVVTCPVAGYPIESIVWERDNRPLPINRKQKVFPNGTLIIENVERNSDQATYTCVAKNSEGYSARGAIEIQVMVLPQIMHFEFENPVDANNIAMVNCAIMKGDPPFEIIWKKDGRKIDSNDGIIILRSGQRASLLNIESAQARHAGNYTCQVKSQAGLIEYTAELHVSVLPQIMHFEFENPVDVNNIAMVNCAIMKGDPPFEIIWKKDGRKLDSNDGIIILRSGQRLSILNIESAQARHAGNYTCQVKSQAGIIEYSTELHVTVLPHIIPFEFENPIDANDIAMVNCAILRGDPPFEIIWKKNGRKLDSNDGVLISRSGQRLSILNIESVQARHAGNYTCQVKSQAGIIERTVELHVTVPATIAPFDFGDPVDATSSASIMCNVAKGDGPFDIHFTHNGRKVDSNDGILVTRSGSKMAMLYIESVQSRHAGEYECIVKSQAGIIKHGSILRVNVLPHILPFTFGDEIPNQGDTVSVSCIASKGDVPIGLTFYHNDVPVIDDNGIIITRSAKIAMLSIESLRAEHQGNYTCKASNRAGQVQYSTELNINVLPHIVPFSFGDEIPNEGDTAVVTCVASKGDTPISVMFYHNGDLINDENDVSVMKNSKMATLSIEYLRAEHRGNYTCRASNRAGQVEYSAELNINVAPTIMPFTFGEDSFSPGDSTGVQCIVTKGDSPVKIGWLFNNETIKNGQNGVNIINISAKTSLLNIASINDMNRGVYVCQAKNTAGIAEYGSELKVNVLPTVIPFSFDEEINLGDSIELVCQVKGDLQGLQISWSFHGINDNNNIIGKIKTSRISSKSSLLVIPQATMHHSGIYTCNAKNWAGKTHYSTNITINVPPKILNFEFGEEPSNFQDSASIQCTVISGDNPVYLRFLLNGEIIQDDGSKKFHGIYTTNVGKRTMVLTIDSVSDNHRGNYTCEASNKAGVARHSAILNVNALPFILPFSFGDEILNEGDGAAIQCYASKGDAPIVPPKILGFDFGENPSNFADSVGIQCTATGDTPMYLRYLLNGNVILDDNSDTFSGISIVKLGKRSLALNIDSISDNHRGNYTCEASNAAGVARYSSILNVNAVTDKDAGDYECRVSNRGGISRVKTELIVKVPPRWILEPTDKAFAQGSNSKVECKADGFPKPQITWKKAVGDTPGEYKDLRQNETTIRVDDGGALLIENIQKTNEGYYLCEAINGIGSGLSAVILISVQAPPEFSEKLRNQTARRGEPAVLQCEAKGEKPIGILWNMNNIRLDPKSDNRYTIREEILQDGVMSSLSIKRTERADSALFTCMATNAFGSDDTSINMIIQEVPEMPYALKVLDKSGRTISLSWAKPYDGNSPIKRYLIEFKRMRGSWETDIDRVIVPGHTNEAQVQKLSPATTYNIRIVAENEIGVSDSSEVVTIITAEEAPTGKPQNIKIEPINQTALLVTWKPPPKGEWNGELQGYYVGHKLSSANTSFIYETVSFQQDAGENKEHNLEITNLKTYTQYSVVIQAYNKIGAGPVSDEERQYTAEGTPDQPPSDTSCTTLTSQTIRVSWVSPPLESANGVIKGYKVVYAPSELWHDDKNKDYKKTASSDTVLHGLKKFTNYTMQILATTSGGDGVRSAPIHCQTEQDVPEAPTAVKALAMSGGAILVSWRQPANPNGIILQYTVYVKSTKDGETKSHKVPAYQMSYEAAALDKDQPYEFWVTASTIIGEGQSSKSIVAMPSEKVPAKIASFDETITATFKEDVKLECQAVGVPTPDITWKIRGSEFVPNDRVRQLPEGSLYIKNVIRQDTGEYTCTAENSIAKDSITHKLIVLAPPQSPMLTLTSTTTDSLTLKLKPHDGDMAPLHGYTLHYKPEFGEWETIDVALDAPKYTVDNLYCGSRYQVYSTAYNSIGAGEPSDILNTRTKGSKPILPDKTRFIEVSSNSITLHLPSWKDGGCRMSHFVVEHKRKEQTEWNQISNNVKPGGNFVVLDLEPATWYNLRVTAHNSAGFTVAEYEFATLTATGGTIAPAIEIHRPGMRGYMPWIPEWLDLNVMVPLIATIIVVTVGILVICVAFTRRRGDDMRNGPKDVYYDVVYNQSMGGPGATTIDKRRPDLRDELGYIAPPNRKLPPVPGSNYNTCDRIKRGTVITRSMRSANSTWDPRKPIYEELRDAPPVPRRFKDYGAKECFHPHQPGMEDEICPYATFHLLGFREEMDPTKAMNFQTFPHQNGNMGTMGPNGSMPMPGHVHSRSGSQSMPRGNRYARKNSQGGQSSIYQPAPEYDDPANCAEEDQYRRYTRVNGSMYGGPEYDDPANCAEEDQYQSQYGGSYGRPYDHYGSRGSMESNEISEAECDRDNGPRGNYGETKSAPSTPNNKPAPPPQDSQPTILWQCNFANIQEFRRRAIFNEIFNNNNINKKKYTLFTLPKKILK
uniref:CSON014681 protein n=1 Tax=Culicoides sonorensis TaxID=179676 RepID=A0A336L245_CULSO